jgi:hypothetical protein
MNISSANIGDNGVRVIVEALAAHKHLKAIDFSSNPITDAGARGVLHCIYNTDSFDALLNSNHILASCCFNGCEVTRKMKRRIGR